jgi:hypothetical protein
MVLPDAACPGLPQKPLDAAIRQLLTPFLGGPGQDLGNFQMVPIPILSVLTYSTSSPHDILKVSKQKNYHNLPVARVKCDVVFLVGLIPGF